MQVHPPVPPPSEMPSSCLTRAVTHLRVAHLGLRDMEASDQDRVLLGFFGVAVFGRSVTLALQHLKTWDEPAFLAWYEPWVAQMRQDPLCRFFYELRTDILHDVVPMVGVVLGAWGQNALRPGSVTVLDRPVPTEHRGKPIDDTSTSNLCRLYLAYLDELVESSHALVWQIQDAWQAGHA